MGPFVEETSTKCGHIFCKKCICGAIAAQSKCPTCRRKLKVKDTIRIYLPTSDWRMLMVCGVILCEFAPPCLACLYFSHVMSTYFNIGFNLSFQIPVLLIPSWLLLSIPLLLWLFKFALSHSLTHAHAHIWMLMSLKVMPNMLQIFIIKTSCCWCLIFMPSISSTTRVFILLLIPLSSERQYIAHSL